MTADVVVIGAGFAGLSAAVRLAGAGRSVVVVEQAPRLGGRAASFLDRETGDRVDNGQHVLFGCYRETYAFLRRLGTHDLAPLQPRLALTMAGSDGRRRTLECPARRPPWHLIEGVLRWSAIPILDRIAALRLAAVLRAVRRRGAAAVASSVPPELTVADWLATHHQPASLSTWLWRPLAIAALNQSPDVAAAQPFVRVLGELFGPRPEDSSIGLPCLPLEDLYAEPARRWIEARGGTVLTGARAEIVLDAAGVITGVRAGDVLVQTTRVVSAVPWHAFDRIWAAGVPATLAGIARNAAAMRSSPIVTVNLWFDEPAASGPILGLVDGPLHWLFDKGAIYGTGAGHLAVVASGADDLAAREHDELVTLACRLLAPALGAIASRPPRHAVVVRERRATFSLAPGGPPRPPVRTPLGGFVLAGDWTDTGLPATIESAVVSGHRAADEILR